MHVGCHNKAGYKFNIAYLYDTQNVSNIIYIKTFISFYCSFARVHGRQEIFSSLERVVSKLKIGHVNVLVK